MASNTQKDDTAVRKVHDVEQVKNACVVCGATDKRLLRCARCKSVVYCGQQHQRHDWKTHKAVCIDPADFNASSATATGDSGEPTHIRGKTHLKRTPVSNVKSSNGISNTQSHSTVVGNSTTPSPKSTCIPLYSMREFDMNIDDYLLTPSPADTKVTVDDISTRERAMKHADRLIGELNNQGYCLFDNYLGEEQCGKVLWDVVSILRAGIMKPGQVVSKANVKKMIRGDKISWITGTEKIYVNVQFIMNSVDRLIRYCAGRLGNIKGRTPAMIACYPGDGTGYKRHVDNTVKDGRRVTCLYYLNKGWDCEEMGGQLRMFPSADPSRKVDIEPLFDRLVVFWSDDRTPHEVLPAYHQRFAVTLWYFDSEERDSLKERYFSNLKNAFASNVQVSSGQETSDQSRRVPADQVLNQPENPKNGDIDDKEKV